MKLIAFAVSLVANVVILFALAVRPTLAPPAFRDFFARAFHSTDAPAPALPRPDRPKPAPTATVKVWSALDTHGDLAALVARLKAAGFPIWAIRAIVTTEVDARYQTQARELMEPDPTTPYWKSSRNSGLSSTDPRFNELMRLSHERSHLLKDLLGNYASRDDGDLTSDQRRRFGNLAPAKIAQLEQIEQDYSEMTQQVRAAMQGVTLPEDREKLALLEREKRADLAALLTPDELEQYDLRNSPLAQRLRSQMTMFNATEDEYRTIYQTTAPYVDKLYPTLPGAPGADFMQQRNQAQQQLAAALQSALGDQRYAEYVRSGDPEYQRLVRLADAQSLPLETAQQAYDLRQALSTQSNQIAADPALDNDAKRAALQTLAQNTRAQLLATLGPNAGPTYLQTADNLLRAVERGAVVTLGPGSTSIRQIGTAGAAAGGGGGGFIYSTSSVVTQGTDGRVFIYSGGPSPDVVTTSPGVITSTPGGNTLIMTRTVTTGTSTAAPVTPPGPAAPPAATPAPQPPPHN